MREVFKGLLILGGSLIFWGVLGIAFGRGPLPEDPINREFTRIHRRLGRIIDPWIWRIGFASLAAGIIGRLVTGHF